MRDSEYPEFEAVKNKIISGEYRDKKVIVDAAITATYQIYERYVNKIFRDADLVILDRSYYTNAVWHATSSDDLRMIVDEYGKRGIPRADKTFILFAPEEIIYERMKTRNR